MGKRLLKLNSGGVEGVFILLCKTYGSTSPLSTPIVCILFLRKTYCLTPILRHVYNNQIMCTAVWNIQKQYLYGLALVHFNDMEVKTVDSFSWGQKYWFKCEVVSYIHKNLWERKKRFDNGVYIGSILTMCLLKWGFGIKYVNAAQDSLWLWGSPRLRHTTESNTHQNIFNATFLDLPIALHFPTYTMNQKWCLMTVVINKLRFGAKSGFFIHSLHRYEDMFLKRIEHFLNAAFSHNTYNNRIDIGVLRN